MEEELKNFIKVWLSAIISVSYCYLLSTRIKSGIPRLLSVLPVCAIFLVLPLFFSSVIFCSYTAFYLSLASLKLTQFSFDQGPLFPLPPNLSQFICFTCFPIKLQQKPKSLNHFPKWFFAIKVSLFLLVLQVYEYIQYFPSIVLLGLYPLHVYLELEMLLIPLKSLVTITLGCDLEPQFNEPYLATSLQDFWGRRWNPMVSSILRSGVYAPMRGGVSKTNSGLAKFIAVFTTFIVSGLFHELLYFYKTRVTPSGGTTLFFVLQGVCTAAEMMVKKTTFGRKWALRPAVSRMLTMTFLVLTGGLLYFPQIHRGNTPP